MAALVSPHPCPCWLPQIGWSFDGGMIYGRHLATTNLGYSVALDDCGGHAYVPLALPPCPSAAPPPRRRHPVSR